MSNNYTVPCTISRMPIYHEQKCVFCILNDDFVKRKADWQIIMPVVYGAYDASNNSFLVDETDIKNKHAESVVKDLNPDDNLKDFVYLAESLRNTCFIERSVWEFMNKNPVQIDESFVETYREHLRIWVKVSDLLEKEERFDTTKLMESFKKNTIEGNHKLADMTHKFMMEKESAAMKIAYNVYDNIEKYGSELVKIWKVIETLKDTYFRIEPRTYLYSNPAKKIYIGLAKEFARISKRYGSLLKDIPEPSKNRTIEKELIITLLERISVVNANEKSYEELVEIIKESQGVNIINKNKYYYYLGDCQFSQLFSNNIQGPKKLKDVDWVKDIYKPIMKTMIKELMKPEFLIKHSLKLK